MNKRISLGIGALLLISTLAAAPWLHAYAVHLNVGSNCSQQLLLSAKERNQRLFGELQSQPKITCLATSPVLGLNVSYGTARIAPLLPSVIIIGPQGSNVDVMAHELAHAEIARRVGALTRLRHMPIWFDEGLAMQLDERPNYALPALAQYVAQPTLTVPSLSRIRSGSEFFRPGDQGRLHYALARCVMEQWLPSQQTLARTLQNFSAATAEQTAFATAAQRCLTQPF